MAKEFLSLHGIPFREVHVFGEPGVADELVRLTGSLTAPVVVVGRKFLRGYDPMRLTAMLTDAGWFLA